MFLDESGVTTEMTRRYGWAPRPERVSEAVPAGHWRTLTVLAALTTTGVLASMSIESPTDGDVFLAWKRGTSSSSTTLRPTKFPGFAR